MNLPSLDELTPREQLHHGIRRHFSTAVGQYFRSNPDLLNDERGRKVTSLLMALIKDVLNEIDRYHISQKHPDEP